MIGIGRPTAVEAIWHANRQTDDGDRFAGEILCVEDNNVALIALDIEDVGHDPAFILRGGGGLAHEDRLGCHPSTAVIANFCSSTVEVVLHRWSKCDLVAPIRSVDVTIRVAIITSINAPEFVAVIVQYGFL